MLNTTFRNSTAAAALIAATTLSFNVQAQDEKCQPLKEINGYTLDSGASTLTHSQENIGAVAISAIPGEDLGNTPLFIAKAFEKNEIQAACFINEEGYEEGGSSFSFYVAGQRVRHDGKDVFGLKELKADKSIMKAVALEATIMAQEAEKKSQPPAPEQNK